MNNSEALESYIDEYQLYAPNYAPNDPDNGMSFGEVRAKYSEKIHMLILRQVKDSQDAEEILVDTFLNAYKHYSRFRGECKIQSWLWGIALNLCKNKFRQRDREKVKSIKSLTLSHASTLRDNGRGPEEVILGEFAYDAILQLIDLLPEHQRVVVMLCDIEELSYQEIANRTGLTLQSVKTRIHRGRLALRRKLSALLLDS